MSGEDLPLTIYLGLGYLRHPLLTRGELRVDWDTAEPARSTWWIGKKGRALRIEAQGRVYTRNLSMPGALASLPGRFLNRFNDL